MRPLRRSETTSIDREMMRLTGKKHPRLLFLPTASSDAPGYVENVRRHFGRELGCRVDELLLLGQELSRAEIEERIMSSDIIYVGGGNTSMMMRVWRKLGVDAMLEEAYEKGIVLAGLSAGSICWFRSGLSDSKKLRDRRRGYGRVSGLGFIKALHCPHYDVEQARHSALKRTMLSTSGMAIALENCAGLEVVDGVWRIITSKKGAKAWRTYWKEGRYHEEALAAQESFRPLEELLRR